MTSGALLQQDSQIEEIKAAKKAGEFDKAVELIDAMKKAGTLTPDEVKKFKAQVRNAKSNAKKAEVKKAEQPEEAKDGTVEDAPKEEVVETRSMWVSLEGRTRCGRCKKQLT